MQLFHSDILLNNVPFKYVYHFPFHAMGCDTFIERNNPLQSCQAIDTSTFRSVWTIEKDRHNCQQEIVSPGMERNEDVFEIN